MEVKFFGNTLNAWSLSLGLLSTIFLSLMIARKIILRKLKIHPNNIVTLTDDLLYELVLVTSPYFLAALSIYIGTFFLTLSAEVRLVLYKTFVFIFLIQTSSWGKRAIAFWIEHYLKKRAVADTAAATSVGLISFSVKFSLYLLITLLALHNLGFDITTLIAGLGVGGVAVALAVQNILGDLFASLSIVLDKPFAVGDFIVVSDFMGYIEHIGVKTTRIRSISGEQLIFSNSDLLKSRVRNFKRMSERRIVFNLNLALNTPPEVMARIPDQVAAIISKTPNTRFERCHFLKILDSALTIEAVYWVSSPDFKDYADVAQSINLEIIRQFRKDGIELNYPTQNLFLRKENQTASVTG